MTTSIPIKNQPNDTSFQSSVALEFVTSAKNLQCESHTMFLKKKTTKNQQKTTHTL